MAENDDGYRGVDSPTVADTYAGIARSPVPQIPQHLLDQVAAMNYTADFNTMNGNAEGAARVRQRSELMMQQAREQANRQIADYLFRPSPLFERMRSGTTETFTGGAAMQPPIQFRLPDPTTAPNTLDWSHNSDPLDFPGMISARELDLQRRLDTVRRLLSAGGSGDRVTVLGVVLSDPAAGGLREVEYTDSEVEQIRTALDYESAPVQDSDSYVYRYEFVNGQALKVDEKLKCGTILDAAARPVRKFRIVEE